MRNVLGLAQLLQGRLGEVATRLALGLPARTVISRHGRPVAGIVSMPDLERLEQLDASAPIPSTTTTTKSATVRAPAVTATSTVGAAKAAGAATKDTK